MQTQEKIRTFVAIKISAEMEKELGRFLAELKKDRADVKWVNHESIHLTLKFLGNLTASQVESVIEVVQKASVEFSIFHLKADEKGAFPNLKRPKVFWVGLSQADDSTLLNLQSKMETELAEIGFEKEVRKFHPHLTIGRVRRFKNLDDITEKFMAYELAEIEFEVKEILIMKSVLTPKGAVYSIQKAIPLK